MYFLAALQFGKNTIARRIDPNACHLFCQPKRDTHLAQVVRQRFDDLPIHELQNGGPLVDQRDIGTQCSHKGGVLEAHHAGADNDDFFRKTTQVGKVICIHNAVVVKGNL